MVFERKFELTIFLLQLCFIILFAFIVEYGDDLDATKSKFFTSLSKGEEPSANNTFTKDYAMFQDINIMIFLGIGFLYTFMAKYGYMGVGMNLLLCAISVQWGILAQKWWKLNNGKIKLEVYSLVRGECAAASAVIALGAIFGKTSPLQMVVFTLIEVLVYATIHEFCVKYLQILDIGESVALHMFAAIFGCSTAYVTDRHHKVQDNPNECHSYNSNIFTMMGTLVLWAFWPSFNAAGDVGDSQYRSVMNTYLALIASAITCFAASSFFDRNRKFTMCHIQNSSLAGAVGVGSTCNLMIKPFGALILGSLSGVISVCGYVYFWPFLSKIHVSDPGGINSLHGIPGLLAGIAAIVVPFTASEKTYGYSLYKYYPAMAPAINTTELERIHHFAPFVEPGDGRSSAAQALYQSLYILVVAVFALILGLLTGCLLRLSIFDPVDEKEMYLDETYWDVPGPESGENASSVKATSSVLPLTNFDTLKDSKT